MKLLYTLAGLLLLTACNGNKSSNDEDKNVGLRGDIVAAVYSKPTMDSLMAKINAIPELTEDLKTAKLNRVTEDSLTLDGVAERLGNSIIPFTKGFEQGSFMLINSNENAAKLHESVMNEYGYNLMSIDTTYPPRPFNHIELWRYHSGEYNNPQSYDSITKFFADDLRESLKEEPALVRNVKYLVSVCDLLLVKPKAVDDKTFEGGILMFEIKVYNATSGAKEGQAVIMAKNSDTATSFMDSNLGKTMQDDFLYEDLLKNKDLEILGFLKNKEPDRTPKKKKHLL